MADSIEKCKYHPSFLTDHQYLLVKFHLLPKIDSGPGVWKFNTSLLKDPEYVSLVSSFWSHWQSLERHEDFASLMDWWDQGKFYADQCSRKTSLTRQMHKLKRSFDQGDRTAFGKLCEVQQELRGIALHKARGPQVRARCQWAEEGETSSSFFLNLEHTTRPNRQCTLYAIQRLDSYATTHLRSWVCGARIIRTCSRHRIAILLRKTKCSLSYIVV